MSPDQLIKTVEVSSNQSMAIYKLTEEQANKYSEGKHFMLKHAKYGNYAYNNMNDDRLVSVDPGYYEGFFETEREAYLTAMLVKASSQIYNLKHIIKQATDKSEKVGAMEFTWDYDYENTED